jgi:transcriptional regulator with XRE-family HTH domain
LAMASQPHYIKEWRLHRGLTQEELADKLGMDKGYLSKIENGRRRYDQPFLEAAAKALECDVTDLLRRDPRDPEGIWAVWADLSEAERRQVIEIAKALKRTNNNT